MTFTRSPDGNILHDFRITRKLTLSQFCPVSDFTSFTWTHLCVYVYFYAFLSRVALSPAVLKNSIV